MAKVSQNIEEKKPVLTLEQKIAIQKQNKACQSWLNAYIKDKNRKAAQEKKRLEKEAAKEAKSKKPTKAPQTEAAPTPETALPQINEQKAKDPTWQVPVEVLKAFFVANRMAALPLYLFATRHELFLGILPEKKIPQIAELLKRSPKSIKRKLAQLNELGLCEKKGSIWMFTGARTYTALCGRVKVKLVKVKSLERAYLTTMAYCCFITDQGRRIRSKIHKNDASNTGACVNVQISASYTANWVERSRSTVSSRRKAGKKLGLINYHRCRPSIKVGGSEVRDEFLHNRAENLAKPNEALLQKGTSYLWVRELPSYYSSFLSYTTYTIFSKALKDKARQRWRNK